MQAKLTLRLDSNLIEAAKEYAHQTDRSLSQLVANYFALLGVGSEERAKTIRPAAEDDGVPPAVAELHGCLRGSQVEEGDYWKYIEAKHS